MVGSAIHIAIRISRCLQKHDLELVGVVFKFGNQFICVLRVYVNVCDENSESRAVAEG